MTFPPLSGALEGLRLLEPTGLPRYKAAVERGEQLGFGYYCAYLLTNDFNGDRSARILRTDAKDAARACEVPGLRVVERKAKLGACELVNDGSDFGRAGLRQLKDSLRPAQVHVEFRGSQAAAA